MEYTVGDIKKAYEKASIKIRNILDSDWVANEAEKIGREFNLRIDKIDLLIQIIGLVLLDIIPLSNFVKTIEKELNVTVDKSIDISKRVDDVIFRRVRDIVTSKENEDPNLDNLSVEEEYFNENNLSLIDDIDNNIDNNISFKEKFNKVTMKNIEERVIDPYREPID